MHGTTRPRPTLQPAASGINAVVWIEPGRALVVRGTGEGSPASLEMAVPDAYGEAPAVLAEIARRIGEVDRVLILGDTDLRTALEREIVAIGHHPETIREAVVEGPVEQADLVARLRRLA